MRDLKDGTDAVEERARYELGMIKQNEIFVQVLRKDEKPAVMMTSRRRPRRRRRRRTQGPPRTDAMTDRTDASQDPVLDTLEAVAGYLAAAFESGDPDMMAQALALVARSDGLAHLAAAAGLPRAELAAAMPPARWASTRCWPS